MLSSSFIGMERSLWLRLLRDNRYAVDPEYWPRATLVSLASAWTSGFARTERARYGDQIRKAPVHGPVIVLGHWRSGTSLLVRLMALNDAFAYPNMFQTYHPRTFITTEPWLARFTAPFLPRNRVSDGLAVGYSLPGEDELALAAMTGLSVRIGRMFPRRTQHYDRFLTPEGFDPVEAAAWTAALREFLQKLTWKYNRPLILKSPPHTGRIGLLLKAFPDARFIHIHRDPYAVFRSTCDELIATAPFSRLQRHTEPNLTGLVLDRYRRLHDAYFEQRPLVPDGRLHEVRFESLERDPVGEVERIHRALALPGFDRSKPVLARHVKTLSAHRKNLHPPLSAPLRDRIANTWENAFEAWHYPR
jgi:hypothetical protein